LATGPLAASATVAAEATSSPAATDAPAEDEATRLERGHEGDGSWGLCSTRPALTRPSCDTA
jgi:hypothetical protein